MRQLELPFAHLNLRWNPFGEASLEETKELAVVQVDQYVERLKSQGFALQFMGDRGRGKTTHLMALHAYFPQAPYLHFAEGAPITEIPEAALLFLDETQRLPRSLRRQVFSRPASFVIGTHLDHSGEFKKAGKEFQAVYLKGMAAEQLDQIIRRRVEWARRNAGPVPEVTFAEVQLLIRDYGDDVSTILRVLYEKFQEMEEMSDGFV